MFELKYDGRCDPSVAPFLEEAEEGIEKVVVTDDLDKTRRAIQKTFPDRHEREERKKKLAWVKQVTAYNNYDLVAANCADISEYREAMQTQHPSDLYNLAHEIATIEDLAYHCEENCDNLDVTCRELWRVGLERLHALARTGDIPVTGDDWYNLMDECATRIKTTQKGQSQ